MTPPDTTTPASAGAQVRPRDELLAMLDKIVGDEMAERQPGFWLSAMSEAAERIRAEGTPASSVWTESAESDDAATGSNRRDPFGTGLYEPRYTAAEMEAVLSPASARGMGSAPTPVGAEERKTEVNVAREIARFMTPSMGVVMDADEYDRLARLVIAEVERRPALSEASVQDAVQTKAEGGDVAGRQADAMVGYELGWRDGNNSASRATAAPASGVETTDQRRQLIDQARERLSRLWLKQGWRAEASFNSPGNFDVWTLDATGQHRIVMARGLSTEVAALMTFVSTALPQLCDLAEAALAPKAQGSGVGLREALEEIVRRDTRKEVKSWRGHFSSAVVEGPFAKIASKALATARPDRKGAGS